MYSVLNTFSEYTYLYISKKHCFILFCCLFLKLSKAFSVSLSNKYFNKDAYKLLRKNLNFVPTIKKLLDEKINDFYRSINLKAHFNDNTKVKEKTGEEIFKKPTYKKSVPNKNHHTIQIFTEATKTELKMSLKLCAHTGPPTYLKKDHKH